MNLTDFWKQYKATTTNGSVSDFWDKYRASKTAATYTPPPAEIAAAQADQSQPIAAANSDIVARGTDSPWKGLDSQTVQPHRDYLSAILQNNLYEGNRIGGIDSQIYEGYRYDPETGGYSDQLSAIDVSGEGASLAKPKIGLEEYIASRSTEEQKRNNPLFYIDPSQADAIRKEYALYEQAAATPNSFVDLSGRMIAPGTKVWAPDKSGYIEYTPTSERGTTDYGSMAGVKTIPRKDINAGLVDPKDWTGDAVNYTGGDSSQTTLATPTYLNSWTWKPTTEGGPTVGPEASWLLYGAGVLPQSEWEGTIGQGGWNAIKGVGSAAAGSVAQIAGGAMNAVNSAGQAVGQGTEQAATMGNVFAKGIQNATGLSNNVSQAIGSGISGFGGAALTGGGFENAGLAGLTGGLTQGLTPAVQDYLKSAGMSEEMAKGLSSGLVSSGVGSATAAALGKDPMFAAARGLGALSGGLTSGYTGQNWLGNLTSQATNYGLSQLYRK